MADRTDKPDHDVNETTAPADASTAREREAARKAESAQRAQIKTPDKPKTPAKPKTTATRGKTTAKRKAAKPKSKAAPRSNSSAPRSAAPKTATKTKTSAKPKSPAKPAPRPRTVADLLAHVDTVEAKLVRADAATRRKLRTLDAALDTLAKRSDTDISGQRASLVRRIDTLKGQLSTLAYETRRSAREDLRDMLAAESGEERRAILAKVETLISASEAEQSRAVARLNSHLADMARAMEARLVAVEAAQSRETDARQRCVDALTGRIDTVEAETARAVTDIGERMVALATRLRADIESVRADGSSDAAALAPELRGQLEAVATETQARFDRFRASVEERLGEQGGALGMAAEAKMVRMASDHAREVSALTARIETLEATLGQPAAPAMAPVPSAVPEAVPAATQPALSGEAAPIVELMPHAMVEEAPQSGAEAAPDTPDHFPVEWTPTTPTQPQTQPQIHPQAHAGPSAVAAPQITAPFFDSVPQPDMMGMPGQAPAAATVPRIAPAVPQPMPDIPDHVVPRISDADLPFTDPGYAETDAGLSRPGGGEAGSDGGSILSRLRGRHMRTVGLGALVLVGGTFALRSVLGGDPAPAVLAETAPDAVPSTSAPLVPPPRLDASGTRVADEVRIPDRPEGMVQLADGAASGTPIMDVSDTDIDMLDVASEEYRTLKAAVRGGNPIAQYQMALMNVERGDLPGAVALVRKAADAGLPPAQYRLAKFYETGQGVTRDPEMAFRLTEMAARRGHRLAMHDTAYFYAEGGMGGPPDHATALQWFDRAASLGVLDSQFNLAYLLDEGTPLGIEPRPEDAYVWYSIAARNGDQQADGRLAELGATFDDETRARLDARAAAFRPQPIDEAANGYFRDLPWMPPGAEAVRADTNAVRQMQTLLNRLGHDTGTPDGVMGPRTAQAIADFQRSAGLEPDGQPSIRVLTALEEAVRA